MILATNRLGGRGVRRVAFVVVALVAAVSISLALRFGSDPRAVETPLLGRPVPDVRLRYLEKPGSVRLRALRGSVIVVNFWASWCIPCRQEHAALLNAAATFQADGVRVLGVLYQDNASDAKAFLDAEGRGYDVLTDPGSRAAIEFGLFGVPETFVVDRHGHIAAKIAGPVDDATLSNAIKTVLRSGR